MASNRLSRQELVDLIGRTRDLAPGEKRSSREARLEAELPDTDILNLLRSDLPSDVFAERCLRHDETRRLLTREQLLALVRNIMEGDVSDEAEDPIRVALFANNCRHPAGTDLIFYPDEVFGAGVEPTPEMVVNKAIAGA